MSRYGQIFTCRTCRYYGGNKFCYKNAKARVCEPGRPACAGYAQDVSPTFRWDFARQVGYSDFRDIHGKEWSADNWAAGTIPGSEEGGTDD